MSLLENGFESAYSGWTSHFVTGAGTIGEVIAAAAHSGGYGFHAVAPIASGNMVYQDVGDRPILYAAGFFKIIQTPTTEGELIIFQRGSVSIGGARLASTGNMRCYSRNGANTVFTTSVKTVNDGQWHFIQYALQIDAVNGLAQLWIDGTLECTTGPYNNTANGVTNRVKMGAAWCHEGILEIMMDDCTISTQAITPTQTYQVTLLPPLVNGVVNQAAGYFATGTAPSGYPYLLPGVNTIPIGEYVTAKAIANAGFVFDHWIYTDYLGVVYDPSTFQNDAGFHSGTPNYTFALQPVFTTLIIIPPRTLLYQSSPIAVTALVNGSPLPAGNSAQFADGAQLTAQVPAEVTV